jgi:hypothetical protein
MWLDLLQSLKWKVLAHPSHSPDLAPSNYHHLFSKLKESLAGKTFSGDDEVQDTVMTWLREYAGEFYDAGIKKFVPRLTKFTAIHGDYVEKKLKVCCKSATSELKNKMLYKYFLDLVSLLSK